MTNEERKIDRLNRTLDEFITVQKQYNARNEADLGRVVRGLYGEEANGTKGLIHAQQQDHIKFQELDKRLLGVEQAQFKAFVWLGVGAAFLTVTINFVKSLFK
jgi:DICT domain-containing protein